MEIELIRNISFSAYRWNSTGSNRGGSVYHKVHHHRGYDDLKSCDINWAFTVRIKSARDQLLVKAAKLNATMNGKPVGNSTRSFEDSFEMTRNSDYLVASWFQTLRVSCPHEGFIDVSIKLDFEGFEESFDVSGLAHCYITKNTPRPETGSFTRFWGSLKPNPAKKSRFLGFFRPNSAKN